MSKTNTVSLPTEDNGPLVLEERLERLEVRPEGLYRVTVKTDHRRALAYQQTTEKETPSEEDVAPAPLKTTSIEFVTELPKTLETLFQQTGDQSSFPSSQPTKR